MELARIDQLSADENYYESTGQGVWLMDNHKWAFYIWAVSQSSSRIAKYSLVHADYHWDGVNDFHGHADAVERLRNADVNLLAEMTRGDDWIRWDSFIAPAVLRGMLSEVHFFCAQDDGDYGLDERLLADAGTTQAIHRNVDDLARVRFTSPVIVDLCLDLFNRADMWYQGDIWPVEDIVGFLDQIGPLLERAEVITVSLSFGYSGTEADTRRLAKLVLPLIQARRPCL